MNINQIMNVDYPIPDPAWDYSQVWHHTQAAAAQLRSLLAYMAEIEDATAATDEQIKSQLDSIGERLNSARGLFNS
jgi:hypothetical protein